MRGRYDDRPETRHVLPARTTTLLRTRRALIAPRCRVLEMLTRQRGARICRGPDCFGPWRLVAAFMEDLTEVARHLAAGSTGDRLDPPLLLALDEIGNLAPLPSLPVLMAEGGGAGITTMPILQSLSQARNKWGDHAASTIWDACIVKIILGGASASKDLQELPVLIGERDERSDTVPISDYGARSLQRSLQRALVMPPERIRTLRFGTGLILWWSAPPNRHATSPMDESASRPSHRTISPRMTRAGASRDISAPRTLGCVGRGSDSRDAA